VVSRSTVTAGASPAARRAGSIHSMPAMLAASPVSTAAHCRSVSRRASPAAVDEASSGTGASGCPAASARCRSNPTQNSSPASCAAAIPTSNCPAP